MTSLKKLIEKIFLKIKFYSPTLFRLLNIVRKTKKNVKVLFIKDTYSSHSPVDFIDLKDYKNTFFGYYDVSPFNPANPNLIILNANNANPYLRASPRQETHILLFDILNKKEKIIDSTRAWNWQQGNRLQWLDADKIIYNKYIESEKAIKAVVQDIGTNEKSIYQLPLQSVYKDEYFLTLDYNLLKGAGREYSYRNLSASDIVRPGQVFQQFIHSDKILPLFDLSSVREEVFGRKVVNKLPQEHVNHILISPCGRKFIFLYRFLQSGKYRHILFLYEVVNYKLSVLLETEVISHSCWMNDSNVLFWGKEKGISGYHMLNISDGSIKLILEVGDGHPSPINDEIILTDTYPDMHSNNELFTYNLKTEEKNTLANFFHPILFDLDTRCDLHPSLSHDKSLFQVDTIFKNRRVLAYGQLANNQ